MTDPYNKQLDGAGLSHFMSLIKKDTAIVRSASGERSIVTEGAADLPLLTLSPVLGESVQDGTPTPDAPKELASVRLLNRLKRTDWLNDTTLINCVMNNLTCAYHDDKSVPSGYYLRFTVVDDTKGAWVYLANMKSRGGMIHGETYVASVWVRASRVISGTFNPMMECGSSVTYPDRGAFTTEWKRFSVRFTFNKNANYQAFYFLYLGNADYTSVGDYFDVYGLQLSLGTELHEYVPNGSIAVLSKGKNLLNLPSWNMMSAYPVSGSYYNCPIYLEPNTTYYLSTTYDATGNPKNGGYLLISQETNNQHWKGIGHKSSGKSDGTLTTGADGVLYLNFLGSQTQYEYFLEHATPQLEKGSAATEYEPYQSHIAYIDLKGHELHGLDSTYYDQLDIDASGHAVLTKRTGTAGPEEFIIYSTPSDGTRCRSSRALAEPPATNNTVPIIKSNMNVPLQFSGSFVSGKVGIVPRGHTDYCGAGTLFIGMPTSVTTKQELLDNYPSLNVLYPLPESSWYTVDLGYVDLPQVSDGGTVRVAAEVQPVIGGTWWTKAGYSTGKLMQDSRSVHGKLELPYTEVEWVESNGKQFVYLDWKPKIATWGFEADFISKNANNTSAGAWNASTNVNGYGTIFGTENANNVNNIHLSSYSSTGLLKIGASAISGHGFKTDKTRQHMKLQGTTFTKPNGTTMSVTRVSETANKPYCNMTVFAIHVGIRRCGTGNIVEPGSTRIYSLKFYDSDTLECDLVGAIRKSDGITGLYDKVAGKFYPAPGCTYGNVVGDLGEPSDISSSLDSTIPYLVAYNDVDTRMLRVNAPTLEKLEDGQSIRLNYLYAIGSSYQTTELAGWDDTGNSAYVYAKITLKNGSETEWIPCFYNGTSRLTTHYYAGYPIQFTYRENVQIGATATAAGYAIMKGLWCDPEYNSDDVYTRFSDSVIAGLNGVKRYSLNMRDSNGNWTSIMNQDNNVNATGKTAYTGGLMLGSILYHNSSANVASGGSTGVMSESRGGIDFRYNVNGVTSAAASTELQLRKPVYLVGTVNATDGLFYLDQTKWWAQDLPITEDGKVYVLVGWAYSSYYAIFLSVYNPAYVYRNGRIQELTNGHVVQKDVPADAVFTDTTALGSMTGTLGVAHGGTGLTSSPSMLTNLGSTTAANVLQASPRPGVTGTLPVANGGTGATTAAGALTNLGALPLAGGTMTGILGWQNSSLPSMTSPQYFLVIEPFASGGTTKYVTKDNAWTALGGGAIGKKASLAASDIPSHASTATTYGVGTNANYGHLKLSDSTSSSSGTSGGIAATPSAVKAAYDLATTANTTAGNALSAATGALAFKVTYSISNGTTTCAAHVYSAGAEVTSTFADSCFQWYYDIGSGWVSLGTGKTKAVTTLSDFGGNVKCDFTPPSS